jgi:hypothetical protein
VGLDRTGVAAVVKAMAGSSMKLTSLGEGPAHLLERSRLAALAETFGRPTTLGRL